MTLPSRMISVVVRSLARTGTVCANRPVDPSIKTTARMKLLANIYRLQREAYAARDLGLCHGRHGTAMTFARRRACMLRRAVIKLRAEIHGCLWRVEQERQKSRRDDRPSSG